MLYALLLLFRRTIRPLATSKKKSNKAPQPSDTRELPAKTPPKCAAWSIPVTPPATTIRISDMTLETQNRRGSAQKKRRDGCGGVRIARRRRIKGPACVPAQRRDSHTPTLLQYCGPSRRTLSESVLTLKVAVSIYSPRQITWLARFQRPTFPPVGAQ